VSVKQSGWPKDGGHGDRLPRASCGITTFQNCGRADELPQDWFDSIALNEGIDFIPTYEISMDLSAEVIDPLKQLDLLMERLIGESVVWGKGDPFRQSGVIREIGHEHVVIETSRFGIGDRQRLTLPREIVSLAKTKHETNPERAVTYRIGRDRTIFWRWEILIAGEVWRCRRGFRSRRSALQSLNDNKDEAFDVARDRTPTAPEIAATYLWREEFTAQRLGPPAFFARLSLQRQKTCRDLVREIFTAGLTGRPYVWKHHVLQKAACRSCQYRLR
jgi:hypothetical protein